jgi:Arc/MetJ family transcription regulator
MVAEAVRPLQLSSAVSAVEQASRLIRDDAVMVAEAVRPLQLSSAVSAVEQASRLIRNDLAQSAVMVAELVRALQRSPILGTAGHMEAAPPCRFPLTEADRRALHRASVFIVVGILVILAMELAPEASSRFSTWLGIAGGLTALVWYLMDQDKQS